MPPVPEAWQIDDMTEGNPQLTIHRSLNEAEAKWRALTSQHACYVFQTFDWISLWHRTVRKLERVEPFIVTILDDEHRPLGLIPLGIRYRHGCRILVFLGGDVTDYNAPLFCRDLEESVIDRLWQLIVQMADVDLVSLQRMPASLPDVRNPLLAVPHIRHAENAYMARPLPATFADFTAGRSRAYFADARRKRRKLERLGAMRLELPRSPQDVTTIVETMLRQKRRRIAESGARPMPPWQECFYRALATTSFEQRKPHVSGLRVAGELVATHLGVLHRNRLYWLMPGYEAGEWTRLSVGRALLQSLFEWCIDHRVECFDLTVGDEEYKRFWSDTRMKLYESRYAVTMRGACFLAGSRLMRRVTTRSMRPVQPQLTRTPTQN
jgi:CelD/BcsL family acetyltransferase involved in cellulose biosynthesis